MRQRSARRTDRAFVVEGVHLLDVALDVGAPLEAVYFAAEARDDPAAATLLEAAAARGISTFALQRGVMERIADTVTPQPVLGVASFVDVPLSAVPQQGHCCVLVDVRDPGNLGSIIRSADAAGMAAVVLSENSADCYNPKSVRASAGSIFRIPVVTGHSVDNLFGDIKQAGFERIGTVVRGGEDYAAALLSDRIALVLGNEAHGLSDEHAAQLDRLVAIPMAAGVESLNVAMAATVLMFELSRQGRIGRPQTI